MGMPLTFFWERLNNPMADKLNGCIEKLRAEQEDFNPEPYSPAAALYFYKEGYRSLSKSLKYDANISLGRFCGAALGRKLSLSDIFAGTDIVVPVPLHPLRRMKRGYNQAEIIAREVSKLLPGSVLDTTLLRRSRYTKSQARLSVDKKGKNVHNAFSVDLCQLRDIPPRGILLVDDVFTTGSTLSECHRCLRLALRERYGAEKAARITISAATLAFVGE